MFMSGIRTYNGESLFMGSIIAIAFTSQTWLQLIQLVYCQDMGFC